MSSRPALPVLLLLGLGALSASHCRHANLCEGSDPGCQLEGSVDAGGMPGATAASGAAPVGGTLGGQSDTTAAGGEIEAGQAGDAGRAGETSEVGNAGQAGMTSTFECQKPMANCDVTQLNGCETDISHHPLHCGACSTPCAGLCTSFRCLAFETAGAHRPHSNLEFTTEYVYYTSGDWFDDQRLVRVDLATKQAEVLAQNLPGFDQVTAGADRIYLWSAYSALWSAPLGGGALVDEDLSPEWLTVNREHLFWLDFPTLHRRDVGASAGNETSWRQLSGDSYVEIAARDHDVVFLQDSDTEPYETRISRFSDDDVPEPQLLASEPGQIVRWRLLPHAIYWLARRTQNGVEHDELWRVSTAAPLKAPELLLSAALIEDFAVDAGEYWAFAYCDGIDFQEIRAVNLNDTARVYRLGTRLWPPLLEADSHGRLWSFDASLERLVSVDVSELP